MTAFRRSSKALAGLLIVSVDSFDRARRSQASPPVRRHFDTKVFYERTALSGNPFLTFPSHKFPLSFPLSLSPPLIREKASHPIKINRVDRAARQVASLGRRKVPSSSEFQVRRRIRANLIKARDRDRVN